MTFVSAAGSEDFSRSRKGILTVRYPLVTVYSLRHNAKLVGQE